MFFQRIREYEEINLEQERKIQILTDEQSRLVENLNRVNATLHDESENHMVQLVNFID